MVRQRLKEPTWPRFPAGRLPPQRRAGGELDSMLAALGVQLDAVVELGVDTDDVVVPAARPGRDRGPRGRHRGRDPASAGGLQEQTAPLTSLYAQRGLLCAWTAAGPSTRSPAGSWEALQRQARLNAPAGRAPKAGVTWCSTQPDPVQDPEQVRLMRRAGWSSPTPWTRCATPCVRASHRRARLDRRGRDPDRRRRAARSSATAAAGAPAVPGTCASPSTTRSSTASPAAG
jgi:hypothetical protein